ncbi:hypothetical protein DPMN_062796 [Dreissena polymorpha]|uniref:Uncharacterized protein n=1 Tax=Dreissena polymorpha TaxID=45954 RepID=A0A9D4HIG1_DREPO|nr:hypothetical protein DPMN_062796 [Dreissena polymorpha]
MKCCSTSPKGEIREGLLIADNYAMVIVISKKFALPISTVEENMRWALRRLRNSCFRLNSQGEIYIDWKILWIEYSCQKTAEGGLTDVWILTPDFTLHEQPNLSRSGVGKPSPVLDQGKLDLLRGPDLK